MPKHPKLRADALLVKLGLAPTIPQAQSLIMAGTVYQETQRIEKASEMFPPDTLLNIHNRKLHSYVSRGGVKLEAALKHFKLNVENFICLDVGASTGGFTDCLLKHGAQKIYALDVGYGQLAWSLQKSPQVIVMDRTNFRTFDAAQIIDAIDLIVIDASFISLKLLIPKAWEILARHKKRVSHLLALIKPQFELDKNDVGNGGIVKNEIKKQACVEAVKIFCVEAGFTFSGLINSPIKGADGNEEFLIKLELFS